MLLYQGKEDIYDNFIKIDWKLNYQCNYNCSYCFRHGKERYKTEPSKEDLETAVANLAQLKAKYIILLSGGEPVLYKNIRYLMQLFLNLDVLTVQITSNGSFSYDTYASLIYDKLSYVFYISIHPEYVNIAHVYELAEKLTTHKNVRVHLALMCHREKLDTVFGFLDSLPDKVTFNLILLRRPPLFEVLENYSPSVVDIACKVNERNVLLYQDYIWKYSNNELEKNIDPTIALIKGKCNYKGLFCCHGSSILRIEQNGRCKGAVCKYTQIMTIPFFKTNIFRYNFIQPVRCPTNSCGCRDNLVIPKFRNGKAAVEYCKRIKENLLGS